MKVAKLLAGGGVVLFLALVAPFVFVIFALGGGAAGGCGPTSPAVGVEAVNVNAVAGLSAEQLHNAGVIIAVAQSMGLDARGQTIGVMTAIGESDLVNIDVGDAAGPDSRGIFQQRANGAWGSYTDRMDPATASANFFKALQGVSGWEAMSLTAAAHAVQHNQDPNYYTRYSDEAGKIVSNATGRPVETAAAVTCSASGQVAPAPTAAAAGAIAWAMARRGTPYLFGGNGPVGPWDCSGFTQAAYASVGISLARDTYGQANNGVAVTRDQVQPGDLWFPEPGHVQMVISPTETVEDPHTGDVIKVSPLGAVGVFRRVAL